MEQDQRLTPLPRVVDLQSTQSEYPTNYSGFYDDEFAGKRSVKQYISIVKKRIPIILAIVLLATIAAAIYSFRQPSIYQATTEMIIEPRKPQVTQKDAININFGNETQYTNTQLQLLQNPDLMKKVVIALNFHHEPTLFGDQNRGITAGIRSVFSSEPTEVKEANSLPVVNEIATADIDKIPLTPEENARAERYAALLGGNNLKIEIVQYTNLVTVAVQSTNAAVAAKVSDKLVETFIEDNATRELEGAQSAYDQLSASIEDIKLTIIRLQDEQMAEQKGSGLPLVESGDALRAQNLGALQAQYNAAKFETEKIAAQYNAAIQAVQTGDILAVVGDNKSIQDARNQNLRRKEELEKRIEDIDRKLNEAFEKRESLLTKYTPEYREVVALNAQISELENQKIRINREVSERIKVEGEKLVKNAESEMLATLRSQLGAAQAREQRALAFYTQAASKANFEGQAETRLTTLKRELETSRGLLDTYTQRQKEQELAISGGRPNNIKISNRAMEPGGPVGPQRLRNIFVAFLMSLAAGIGLAFLLDYLDDSVRTSEDVSRHLGLPTLALIPHYNFSEKRGLSLVPRTNGKEAAGPTTALVTLEDRNSPMAEAYRHLRTSLLFSSAGKPPQTILVTSAQPSEGKTTTAINTAITLAQSDADVVIIDCDLRRPRLHSHFNLNNTHGLTNYLSGEKSTEKLINTLPELPRLKVITSGPIPPNPAELLSSDEMRNLLQFLSGRFKHIILDSPPAISFTDAAILSTLVDGVVLVAMTGKSSLHLMRQFRTRLSSLGARIYGVVLNGVKAGSMDYDYYGSGHYDYYNRSADDTTPRMDETDRTDGTNG